MQKRSQLFPFQRCFLFSLVFGLILATGITGGWECRAEGLPPSDLRGDAVNRRLLKELQARKIVMLADFGHEFPMPYQTIVSLLEKWVDELEQGKNHFRRLTIVLERDESDQQSLQKFFIAGNPEFLFNVVPPRASIESFEFFWDLRTIRKRITSINARSPKQPRVDLDILGAEDFGEASRENLWKASERDGLLWFVNQRDVLSAERIRKYLETHSGRKMLVFYGGAHLQQGLVEKDLLGILTREEAMGFYLVSYLKKFFGEGSVLSVSQFPASVWDIQKEPRKTAKEADLFLSPSSLRKRPEYEFDPNLYDACIKRTDRFTPPHALGKIFSKRVIEWLIRNLEELEPLKDGFLGARDHRKTKEDLTFITQKDFTSAGEWRKWWNRSDFDPCRRLDLPEFANQMFPLCADAIMHGHTENKLQELGVELPSTSPIGKSWQKDIWPEVLKQIKLYNYIGLNLIGTPDEQRIAKAYLIKETGKDFSNPASYVKWWRKSVYRTEY